MPSLLASSARDIHLREFLALEASKPQTPLARKRRSPDTSMNLGSGSTNRCRPLKSYYRSSLGDSSGYAWWKGAFGGFSSRFRFQKGSLNSGPQTCFGLDVTKRDHARRE
jgi:hypothetical protein